MTKPLSERLLDISNKCQCLVCTTGNDDTAYCDDVMAMTKAAARLKELEDAPVGFASAHHDASDNWLEVDALKEETAKRFANKAIKLIEVCE